MLNNNTVVIIKIRNNKYKINTANRRGEVFKYQNFFKVIRESQPILYSLCYF